MAVKRLFIVTGDHSGDQHAGKVVTALKAIDPNIHVAAVGGKSLQEAGAYLLSDQSQMGRVGFGAFTGAPYHFFLGRKILGFLKDFQPDGVLLIDYGGFNLWMAGMLRKQGYRVFYFIPPQVWASRKGRLKKIKATVNRVFCIFPFEQELYEAMGIPVTFVGHPLAGQLPPPANRKEFCEANGLPVDGKLVALLPGSRKSEIQFLLEPILASVPKIAQGVRDAGGEPVHFVMAKAGSLNQAWFDERWQKLRDVLKGIPVTMVEGQTHSLLSVADAAVVKSGTATLETALYQTPMVIVYKVQKLVYEIGRRLVYLPCLGLPNILTDVNNPPVPELLQDDFTAENIAHGIIPLLDSLSPETKRQRHAFEIIRQALGSHHATDKVASELYQLL